MTQQQQQQHSLNSGGIDHESSSTRFNMASLKINLPPQNHKRSRGGGLSRYYSGKSRSFKCLNEVHSIEDLKKQQHDHYNNNNNNIIVPPAAVAVAVDAHHHDSNNNKKKQRNTFSSSSSSSFCSISSMSKEDIKQHTLFSA